MNKFFDFLAEKKYVIMVFVAILLILLTLKTQVVVVTYGEEYSMRMEYTMLGYCIRASAALKATEPAIQNAVYVGGSINSTILEAVEQMKKLSDSEQTVGILSSGYPRNNDKLEISIKEYLETNGHSVEIVQHSLLDVLNQKK